MDEAIEYLPKEIKEMIENPSLVTPYGYLNYVLRLSQNSIIDVTNKQYLLTETIKSVRSAVAIFIDNVDECFGEHLIKQSGTDSFSGALSSDIWYAAQIGLMKAIWTLSATNRHIKIFTCIRREAYSKLCDTDPMALQIIGSTLDIEYTKDELKSMFIKNIKRMKSDDLVKPNDTDPFQSFLGLEKNEITNTRVGNKKERIFEYIYRHTLKRPRDLMAVGQKISALNPNARTEKEIKDAVDKAATELVTTYLTETKPHLDFFDFEKLFDMLHSNILTEREIKEICKEFNGIETCENKNCNECKKIHPFCSLYKIGLLGIVWDDPVTGEHTQKFLRPGDEKFELRRLPQSKYYLLHPTLNSLIYERNMALSRTTYNINPRTIVGDGYSWEDPKIFKTTRYCSLINRDCKTDRFVDTRGVFLASSYNKKNVIEDLSKELTKRKLNIDIDKWMDKEKPGIGRIFCDEVCPKIFKNYWMVAEVSDFNPNVFFECGFAMGLGRNVTFLCNKNAKLIRSEFEKLHLPYETINEIIDQLEWTKDTFGIEINSVYGKIRLFNHVDNFDSPSGRKKSNDFYVLSFNPETDIIRKLSKRYGCKIVEVNRLRQSFIPVDLVEELINAKALLFNLYGLQEELNNNRLNDSQLMCLAGICVSQGVPVKIFQSNNNFYSDVSDISLCDDSGEGIVEYINRL